MAQVSCGTSGSQFDGDRDRNAARSLDDLNRQLKLLPLESTLRAPLIERIRDAEDRLDRSRGQ